jgi:hypothetical protein
MPSYLSADEIQQRLPYSATALGFADGTEYDEVLGDIRDEEVERIEEWGDVVTEQSEADALHDGSSPVTAFEEFTVTNNVDGAKAVRTPREVDHFKRRVRGDLYYEYEDRRYHRDEPRDRTLPLPGRPVKEVTSVEPLERDVTLTVGEDVYLEADAVLVLDRDAPLVEWHEDRRSVRVEYTFGHTDTPARIQSVLVDLVHWRLGNDQSLPVSSESVGGDSFDYRSPDEILSQAFGTVLDETDDSHSNGVFSV